MKTEAGQKNQLRLRRLDWLEQDYAHNFLSYEELQDNPEGPSTAGLQNSGGVWSTITPPLLPVIL